MIRALTLAFGGVFLASALWAEDISKGDAIAGRKVANMCRTCHGLDGYAKIPIAPHIGGEPATYLAAQLQAFRDGSREHEMMTVVARGLNDDQIADVSSWYAAHKISATLPASAETAPEECVSCHGETGLAVVEDAPHLAGETNIYIETQLKAFRSGKRENAVMNEIAAELTDAEIRAIANWFSGISIQIDAVE